MKNQLLCALAAGLLVWGASTSAKAADVSVEVFYEQLEPYGEWVDTDDYGYIWHPRDVDEDWRPYTVGNWAYTDAGWTWVSEEPFGWATYHYGRWVELDRVGWSWVPDREWGPAWVSWRRSDRHVGWAPLPPEARFESRTGLHAWVDSAYDIGPTHYSFVAVRDFGAPRLRTVILPPRENITIVRETRNITNITYVNNVVMNNGPQYDVITRETSQPIRRLRLDRRTDFDFTPGGDRNRFASQVSGDSLRVIAPAVAVNREIAPRRVSQKLQTVQVDRGWNRAGDPQAVRALRTQVASEAKPPADLPVAATIRRTIGAPAAPGDPAATAVTPSAPPAGRKGKSGANNVPPAPATAADGQPGIAPGEPTPGRPPAVTAREGKGKGRPGPETARPPGAPAPSAETKSEPNGNPAAPAPRPKGKGPRPAAESPEPANRPERPDAPGADRMPPRPEARDSDRPTAPGNPPQPGKGKKRNSPAAPSPESARPAVERPPVPNAERPEPGARPEMPKRPDANAERPGRPEGAERPERRTPPAPEDRGPARSKPGPPDRSPENRPPGGEGRTQPAEGRPPAQPQRKGAPAKPAAPAGQPEKDDKKDKKGD